VTGVIEAQLKKNGDWLVGNKCSYADLAFVPWYWLCPAIMGEGFDKVSSPCSSSLKVFDEDFGRSGGMRCADGALFFARNGSPSTRPAGPGTRRCSPGLRSRRLGRTERRRWPSDRRVETETRGLLKATVQSSWLSRILQKDVPRY
jgi:hypothetical protein